jgi:hypothetical protein
MAHLHYMSLPGVGSWDATLKETGAQFRPYEDYLLTAIKAARRRAPLLRWRPAHPAERAVFEQRLETGSDAQVRRTHARRRRNAHQQAPRPSGVWIVLEPPPWKPEEPDDTFDAFLGAREVHEQRHCKKQHRIRKLAHDREGRALLLERLPVEVAAAGREDQPAADALCGPLLWLQPETYTLDRQSWALQNLENEPSPRLAPLVRLASTRANWPDFEMPSLPEDAWVFLRPKVPGGALLDGTDEQRRFVSMAMATTDFAILDGPPGSGKTTAICEFIVQQARLGKRILLVAPTHVAVDNVLERLLAWQDAPATLEKPLLPVRIGDEESITSAEVLPWSYHRLQQTWRDELLDFLEGPRRGTAEGENARDMLRETLRGSGRDDVAWLTRLLLDAANLVCGTTLGILKHPAIRAMRDGEIFEPFDVMLLDEASKTTFTEFLVPALHARKWIVVGDVRQLSPYVEEVDLAENVRGLVPEENGSAAVQAFLASTDGRRPPALRSLVATEGPGSAELLRREASERGVHHVDLDACAHQPVRDGSSAVIELLFADLVSGSPASLRDFEHRLPPDLLGRSGCMPELPTLEAATRAFVSFERKRGRRVELDEDPAEWGNEVAWRLIRSYELRQNADERGRLERELDALVPKSLDESWFGWRRMRAAIRDGQTESAQQRLGEELRGIRRVAMPSILELLQHGFERLSGWREGVALNDGLPANALRQRMVSLSFQHRMHPHISAFPREHFYASARSAVPGPPGASSDSAASAETPLLLRDASTVEAQRAWGYTRYAKRAQWLEVAPERRRGAGNTNEAEGKKIMEELRAFAAWAHGTRHGHGRRDAAGPPPPWEVAILTFYRGQEALLRTALQRESGQYGNSRTFSLPRGQGSVKVTLCTVDRFQGHEADLVLLSFVKSGSVGFLNSPNRLNVALTRARYQLVLVGHRAFFKQCSSPLLNALGTSQFYEGDIGWEEKL